MNLVSFSLLMLGVFLNATAQLLLKAGTNAVGQFEFNAGNIVPPPEFLPALRKYADDNGALLICDEMICGFGRTGKEFGHCHFDVKPDIITVGKGMGNGFPVSGLVTRATSPKRSRSPIPRAHPRAMAAIRWRPRPATRPYAYSRKRSSSRTAARWGA